MALVQVILSEDVHALGDAGEIVSVKPGYARNYLIPKGMAMVATAERVNEIEHKKRVVSEKLAKELKDLKAVKSKLDAAKLEVSAQAGDGGKLFGSVTAAQLAELLGEKGLDVDRRKIQLNEPIKQVGVHKVAIRLRSDVMAEFEVTVISAGAPPVEANDDEVDEGPVGLGAAADAPEPAPLDDEEDDRDGE
jgi:large subunit ribosomal protein L9